ncbi:site-specific integrase [Shimia thalassica]|uniref:site-specific integrase n=1 Tax=Shimia thalassica TaxID=1715693 RepID=UPI0026E288FB|nr:site-specific integrase [Shimia thalassica]MDO6799401.1 site-specific integrase [Shimia thalassica]
MKLKFPGYVPEKMKSGETRHRVRVEGNPKKRIRIPVGPSDPSFTEHYYAARAGYTVETKPVAPAARDSLDELARDYLDWFDAQVQAGNFDHKTLKQRKSLMTNACDFLDPEGERLGSLHHQMPPEGIVYMMDQWGDRTSQADNSKKAFSAMYRWAIPRGRATSNPCTGIRNTHKSKGGATPWSSDDVKQFLKFHGPGTSARRWLYLALFTTCRISDAVVLGRSNEVIREGVTFLEWQPKKKGSAFVAVPIMPQLLDELRAAKVEGKTYILNAYGRPFRTTAALHERIRRWVKEAELQNRSQHGLRKAMAELMAEQGATQHQIMSVMAHTKPTTSAVYTDKADRRRLAVAAIESVKSIKIG